MLRGALEADFGGAVRFGVDLMLLKINFLRKDRLIWFSSIINNLNETVI